MFKKLKSLFVVEEDVPDIEKQLEKAVPSGHTKPSKTTQPSTSSSTNSGSFESSSSGTSKPKKKFTDILIKAIDKSNLDGADYLEFKSSLKSLESVIDDEATRYKSSFAVLNTSGGITKQKLLSTGEHYIKVLQQEKGKFEQTFQDQQNKQIKVRQDKITTYEKSIAQKKEQLKQLIKQIEDLEKKMETSKVDISHAAAKVQLTKDEFMASYMMIVNQMQGDFEKINEYLS